MFGEKFKRKYALSDKGVSNTKKGMAWTIVVNLLMMTGIGLLYFMMQSFISTLTDGTELPNIWLYIGLTVLFVILSLITHLMQYHATYGLVYGEIKGMRIGLAERLRKLPLGYFGKRDLADLTETIMGDVNRMEHVWSHVLGYLYGSYARGDYHSESDVDIFLTSLLSMPEIEKKRWDISGVASDLSIEHEIVVSVCVRPQESFQPERHPYYANIVRDGIRYGGPAA